MRRSFLDNAGYAFVLFHRRSSTAPLISRSAVRRADTLQ
jgi:hypothetical protein